MFARIILVAALAVVIVDKASAEIRNSELVCPGMLQGQTRITESARTRIRVLLNKLHEGNPDQELIPSVIWSEQRGYKMRGETRWHDSGPGLEIGFYSRDLIPSYCIRNLSGLDVAFVHPEKGSSIFDGKTIDFTEGRFVLKD